MTADELLMKEQGAERAACAAALLAVFATLMVHLWSPAARALRSGPVAGVLLISDSLDHPGRTDAAWLRYDPRAGLVDVVSVPAEAALNVEGAARKMGRAYASVLKELPDAGGTEPRTGSEVDLAQARRFQEASARTAGLVRESLRRQETMSYLHLDSDGARLLGAGAVDPDDAAVGMLPALRGAAGLARTAVDSPEGAWRFLRALSGQARGLSDLSRYDLAVFALEASALPPSRVRPVQLPQGRRGELKTELLQGLWDAPHLSRNRSNTLLNSGSSEGPIQVEVLNGSDKPGAAADVTRTLRARGVDVVYYGNLPARLERTWVVDRIGDREAAVALARWLPAARPQAWTALAPERLVHASVLLGNDLK